jgi:probable F420-dependent oxidoreductase
MSNSSKVQLGVTLSLSDTGGEPAIVRALAQAAEALGYDHLALPDHVLGANIASRPDWGSRNTSKDLFHDPFVLFGYLSACTEKIGFSTQVLILAQRQTALVAKQAASLDVLCNGRLRLGVGIGWNAVEFTGLNEDFSNRGKRSEEQVELLQKLWANEHVDFRGQWHTIEDAGINPLPPRRRIPIWFGGHVDATLRRIARWGDGWMMLEHPPGDDALAAFAKLRSYAEQAGRNPDDIGLEVWVSVGQGDADDWRREFQFWQAAGVTHITLNNAFNRYQHTRMPGRSLADHLAGMARYHAAVADLL